MPPLRIWFDLANEEPWHRREFETMISASQPASEAVWAASADLADCVVTTNSAHHFGAHGLVFRSGILPRGNASPRFVWSGHDHPTGYSPGLYCSLPRPLFDEHRHRTYSYPFRYNEQVQAFDLGDARWLFGFVGGVTSRLRHRLLRELSTVTREGECLLKVQTGPWQQMFDRSGNAAKIEYAEALRRSRFFLCPRGNGVGSVRLFEALEAARVPVIISDAYVLPAEIDWDSCAVRVRERDLASIPQILRERADDWPRLAMNARSVWEQHFSHTHVARNLGQLLRPLLPGARMSSAPSWDYLRRVTPFFMRVLVLKGLRKYAQAVQRFTRKAQ